MPRSDGPACEFDLNAAFGPRGSAMQVLEAGLEGRRGIWHSHGAASKALRIG